MEFMDWLGLVFAGFLGAAPAVIFWIIVLVIAVIIMRRGGGKPEKLLVIGAGICILGSLLSVPQVAITPYMISSGGSTESASGVASAFSIVSSVINAAGMICFIYAFWLKFNTGTDSKKAVSKAE